MINDTDVSTRGGGQLVRLRRTPVPVLPRAARLPVDPRATWIAQSRLGGLALIEKARIVLSNPRFDELNRLSSRGGRWIISAADRDAIDGLSSVSLDRLLVALAGEVLRRKLPPMLDVRCGRDRGEPALRLRLERGPATSVDPGTVLAFVDDITPVVRAEAELARARRTLVRRETLRAIGEIASGVTHDLANLLSAMQMRISVMQKGPDLSDPHVEGLEKLSRILRDGTGMISRLQDFVRFGVDQPIEPLDLAAVIRESVEMVSTSLADMAALAGIQIGVVLKLSDASRSGRLPRVLGAAADLRHTIINLLINARDAMPAGGDIQISARHVPGAVLVKVEDQGTGVPPEIQDRIFDAFFTTKGDRGTGLGLSMARDLMKRIGGDISVANRRGGGAAFTLRFVVA